jgi:hypothetical protein
MSYIEKKKSKNTKKEKIKIKLPLSTISKLLYYSLTINDLITVSNLVNLRRYINMIDIEKSFNEENELTSIQLLRLLMEILNLNIDYTVDSISELKETIIERNDETEIPRSTIDMVFDHAKEYEFDEKKIIYWNKFIQNQLDSISIYQDIPILKEVIETFEHPDPKTNETILPVAKEVLINLNRKFNLNSMDTDGKLNSFNITDRHNAKTVIRQSLESIYNPGNKIPTGYKLLDKMLGGGLQEERCYLLLGVAKSFKSGTMLNIVMNIVTNYVDYQLKDPEKTPAVLYFTMENSMIETFERIYRYLGIKFDFKYTTEKNKNGKVIKKYHITDKDVDNILDVIEKETIEKTGIALRIEFRTHMSVDTGELDKLYENYALIDNQEIIFVAQDYIKRIHSQRAYRTEQKRDELGEVINEFCNFSKIRKIPVLTASQLNRDGLKVVESAKSNRKKDLARKLGGSQVGESSLIYENADYTIITNREKDEDSDTYYQTFKCIMARGDSGIDYFAQPFEKDPRYCNFKIATDYDNAEPLGVERISDSPDKDDINVIANSNQNVKTIEMSNSRKRKKFTNISTSDNDEELESDFEYNDESLSFD